MANKLDIPAHADGAARQFTTVRDAGPASMIDPAVAWDSVDEASDASFPASDPPNHSVSHLARPPFYLGDRR